MRREHRRRVRWVAVVPVPLLAAGIVLAGAFVAGTLPARAQDDASLSLAAIPAWVQPGGPVTLALVLAGAPDGAEIVATAHDAVGSRTQFERTIRGTGLGAVAGRFSVRVADLDAASGGARALRFTLDAKSRETAAPPAPGGGAPSPALPLEEPGVYPLRLTLRPPDTEAPLGEVFTHLVVADAETVRAPLAVAWVWPMEVSAPFGPDDAPGGQVAEAVDRGGRLAGFVEALASGPNVPLTLAPRPGTIDAWADLLARREAGGGDGARAGDDGAVLATLHAVAEGASRQVASATYAPTDLVALRAAGMASEVDVQLATGLDVTEEVLGVRPDPDTFVAGRVDDGTIAALRRHGVDRLVLDPTTLVPIFENLTPARPFEVRATRGNVLAARGDRALAALLEPSSEERNPGGAVLAQRLLAGLAVVALEVPAEQRGVVVLPADDWSPEPGTLIRALRGLRRHPVLDPVTLDGFFERVEPVEGTNAVRELITGARPTLAVGAEAVREARRDLASLRALVPEDTPAVVRAERMVLLAESSRLSGPAAASRARVHLEAADRAARDVLAAVKLPGDQSVTLTSRRASIPVALQNRGSVPVRVRVRLASEALGFPGGESRVVELAPRATTVEFTVETRTSGSFPVTVEVSSPDGRFPVGAYRMVVRSTAVSGVALTLTVGAGVFLAGWWGNHVRRARRARRAAEVR